MRGWVRRYDTESAPVFSLHNEPQDTPQEYGCRCVTAVHVTDRDTRAGGLPFEMRLVERCRGYRCEVRRTALDALLIREDLLSSRDWPWTTDVLLRAYVQLQREGHPNA